MNVGCSRCLNVMVMHPDPILCAGLVASLGRQANFKILVRGSEHVELDESPIDVVISDYPTAMSLTDSALEHGDRRLANAHVLVLTGYDGEADIRRAIQAGIRGYVLLGASVGELVDAIQALGNGARFMSPAVAQRMADSLARVTLTAREDDVLRLVASGRSNKEIARILTIELGTVKSHMSAIMSKLGAASRTQAASIAVTRGVVADLRPPEASALRSGLRAREAQPHFA